MDASTLSAYDANPAQFARDWLEQPEPTDLSVLLREHFKPGPTVDIGCGAGRDVAWLATQGFEASGFDASPGLVGEARARYPTLPFGVAALPELAGLPEGAYENVLCETVVMHLDPALVGAAARRLLSLLRPSGTLFLSWRVTPGESMRDRHGRLYAAFDAALLRREFASQTLLLDREDVNRSSGKTVHRLLVRKTGG